MKQVWKLSWHLRQMRSGKHSPFSENTASKPLQVQSMKCYWQTMRWNAKPTPIAQFTPTPPSSNLLKGVRTSHSIPLHNTWSISRRLKTLVKTLVADWESTPCARLLKPTFTIPAAPVQDLASQKRKSMNCQKALKDFISTPFASPLPTIWVKCLMLWKSNSVNTCQNWSGWIWVGVTWWHEQTTMWITSSNFYKISRQSTLILTSS